MRPTGFYVCGYDRLTKHLDTSFVSLLVEMEKVLMSQSVYQNIDFHLLRHVENVCLWPIVKQSSSKDNNWKLVLDFNQLDILSCF